jgi:dipeptidyl aminopeptidase/acylaminoacyl peptidase
VSDLSGLRRWIVATERVGVASLTRWRPDGNAVAFVRERKAIVIAPLVGSSQVIALPSDLAEEGYGIVGYHWSSDGSRLAVSLRDALGASREGDVWVVDVGPGLWRRVTELGDALAGPWIDSDEVLVESLSGFIGVVRVAQEVTLRPVTGMTAVSPQIGRDGRLYVAGGGGGVGPQAGTLPYGQGGIWSMALDGSDVRRERGDQASEIRLLGRWTDGRFVVSRAGSAEIIGEPPLILPWSAGTIRRVEPLTEREVLAFTDDRVLRLDPQLVTPLMGMYTPSPGLSVLLDRVYEADLWRRPAAVEPVRTTGAQRAPTPPSAFVMGKAVWLVEGGDPPHQLFSARADQWVGRPEWSPDGKALAVTLSGSDAASSELVIFDVDGRILHRIEGRGGRPVWSPDSRSLAREVWTDARSEIHIHRLDRPDAVERIDGSSAVWTDRGLFVLVTMQTGASGAPIRQRIELRAGDERRSIVDSAVLAAHPQVRKIGATSQPLSMYGLTAPSDGALVAVTFYRGGAEPAQGVVVIRVSDAAVVTVVASDRHGGFLPEWSPRGDLFARNAGPYPASNAEDLGRGSGIITEVLDPLSGKVVTSAPGQFAGWAPDGVTFYVARPEGLFAHQLAGGEGVIVSPYGVPVSIAPR